MGSYAEQVARSGDDPNKRLEPMRSFLLFARKEGFTKANLSVHLRFSFQTSKRKTATKGHKHREMALTAQGYEELKRELEALKKERPRAQEEIRRAAADKDVRENAPLEAAREYHGHLESRIRELEGIIDAAKIEESNREPAMTVSHGNMVTIRDLDSGEMLNYTLVDPREVNPTRGKISFVSPVGKALMGKAVGEVIAVDVPAGRINYRIEKIEPEKTSKN